MWFMLFNLTDSSVTKSAFCSFLPWGIFGIIAVLQVTHTLKTDFFQVTGAALASDWFFILSDWCSSLFSVRIISLYSLWCLSPFSFPIPQFSSLFLRLVLPLLRMSSNLDSLVQPDQRKTLGIEEKCIQNSSSKNMKGRNILEDLGVEGRILLG
jgi:hypothetical protein